MNSLLPFLSKCDSVVANLEAPLVNIGGLNPPSEVKTTTHRADLEVLGRKLRDLGVDAVNLANRSGDLGPHLLDETLRTFSNYGIPCFGAGRTILEARRPFRLSLPDRVGGGAISFHGARQYSARQDTRSGVYATESSSGNAPLSVGTVPWARLDSSPEDTFHVAFPHWGTDFQWRQPNQYRLTHRYLRKDYDLVLGHGSHNLQEVHRKQRRWVVYGLGNGNFHSESAFQKNDDGEEVLPFIFRALLEIQRKDNYRRVELKLYPISGKFSTSQGEFGAVTEEDFKRVLNALRSRPARPWRLDNPAQSVGEDELGYFLSLDLGTWPEGQRPSRLEPLLDSGDPGDWPSRGPSVEIEDRVMALNKTVGAGMLALNAEVRGGSSTWLTEKLALIEVPDKRFLTYQYKAHESVLGATICIDKVLSASFFEGAGVSTPKTVAVDTADDAVQEASKISGPVVVKPRNGTKSRGVSTGLVTEDEIREGFAFAKSHGSQVLVQQHIEAAEELRVMASNTEAVAVIRRVLPHVTGDGTSTVMQLIEDKNQQRTLNPSLRSARPIPMDALTDRHLSRQGYSLSSVLNMGHTITVRNIAALSVGADAHQALESSDSQIRDTAAAAVAAVPGLGWGGVDLIIEEGTEMPYVVEINTNAAYGAALFPTFGHPLNVAEKVWDLRYAATAPNVRAEPESLRPAPETRCLSRNGEISSATGALRFSDLFTEFLKWRNYQVDPNGSGVLNISSPEGTESWVTNTGFTKKDRSVVWFAMRRHRWIRKLLSIARVPTPRGREVSSAKSLRLFTEGRVSRVVLFPVNGSWYGPEDHVVTADEVMGKSSLPTKMWVQTHPHGDRVRVLATPEKSWTVTASSRLPSVSELSVGIASEVAVQAVRSIPELRWAAVDILLRPRRLEEDRPGGALVEGLTVMPEFAADTNIIAGDFDAFASQVVGP